MRVVLHIGTDKTGTTSIQRHLSANRDWIEANSCYIPRTGFGLTNGHSALLQDLDEEQLAELREELIQTETAGYRQALLTWEGMHFYQPDKIALLQTFLDAFDVSIIVYLREQAEIIQSGQLQQIKSNTNDRSLGALIRPRSLREAWVKWRFMTNGRRNYWSLLTRWREHFPQAEFIIRPYQKKALLHGDAVDDFLAQLGLKQAEDLIRLSEKDNYSLDVATALAVENWQVEGRTGEEIDRLVDIAYMLIVNGEGGARYFLSRWAVWLIRRYFQRSNRRVAAEYLDTGGVLFDDMKPCWRSCQLQDLLAESRNVARAVLEIDQTPTLASPAYTGQISDRVILVSGWSQQKAWGVWSNGADSVIRFRIPYRTRPPGSNTVRLLLRGRYHANNAQTRVMVNGRDYGWQSLDHMHEGLEVPVEVLSADNTVRVELHHDSPVSPGGEDSRLLAYGLEQVAANYQ